jgi:hypothetical protein
VAYLALFLDRVHQGNLRAFQLVCQHRNLLQSHRIHQLLNRLSIHPSSHRHNLQRYQVWNQLCNRPVNLLVSRFLTHLDYPLVSLQEYQLPNLGRFQLLRHLHILHRSLLYNLAAYQRQTHLINPQFSLRISHSEILQDNHLQILVHCLLLSHFLHLANSRRLFRRFIPPCSHFQNLLMLLLGSQYRIQALHQLLDRC